TDDSQTIVDALTQSARNAGIIVRTHCGVRSAARQEAASGRFALALTSGETATADRLLIATGGTKSNAGFEIARAFGHTIEPPVPSLFTFHIDDPRLRGLAGVSVESAATAVPALHLRESGPLLVTHWGLSGP